MKILPYALNTSISKKLIKNIAISIILLFLLFLGFLFIKNNILSNRKVDLKPHDALILEYIKTSKNISDEEGIETFHFESGACKVSALIYGIDIIEKLEYHITFNSSIIKNKSEEARERKEEIACLQFGVKTIASAFQSKKTKQEFVKLTKTLFKELKNSPEANHGFFNKNVAMKIENGILIIISN